MKQFPNRDEKHRTCPTTPPNLETKERILILGTQVYVGIDKEFKAEKKRFFGWGNHERLKIFVFFKQCKLVVFTCISKENKFDDLLPG